MVCLGGPVGLGGPVVRCRLRPGEDFREFPACAVRGSSDGTGEICIPGAGRDGRGDTPNGSRIADGPCELDRP